MTTTLGQVYADKITGCAGVAVARTETISGRVFVELQPRSVKDGVPVKSSVFEESSVAAVDASDPAGDAPPTVG